MSQTPLAFLSYVNLDDQHDQGRLTQFRERLSHEVSLLTGEAFDIFQDKKDIALGQQWEERINDSLDATTFLIPIITPAFFKSDACRAELERFLKREEKLGRGDLIVSIYYVTCPVLKDEEKRKHDPLAKVIAARQYMDWTKLRLKPFDSEQVCETLANIAEQIAAALERSEAESVRAEAVRQAGKQPEKESEEATSQSNTFQSGGGGQSIGQGKGAIGTQINYYGPQVPIEALWQLLKDAKPQPAQVAKTGLLTLVVDQRNQGDYATITEALKAAKAGTRILVQPGLYREGIVLDKPVEIIGDGKRSEIVIQADGKHTVLFKADSGRIANLTLRQTGGGDWYGVNIAQGRLELEACDISSKGLSNVAIHSSANPILRRNRIHDGKQAGVFVYDNGQGTLEDNEIFANAYAGVGIKTGGKPTLRRNRISLNGDVGIGVYSGGGGIFEDNNLRGNARGAWFITPDCEALVQRRANKE